MSKNGNKKVKEKNFRKGKGRMILFLVYCQKKAGHNRGPPQQTHY